MLSRLVLQAACGPQQQHGLQALSGAASLCSDGVLARLAGIQASTSGSSSPEHSGLNPAVRWYAKKAPAKKGTAGPQGVAVAPSASTRQHVPRDPRAVVARMRNPGVEPLSLLSEEQQKLVQEVAASRAAAEAEEAAAAGPSYGGRGAAAPGPPAQGLKALGLPLDERAVVSLVHQSLSGIAGHNVHFRPLFFSNVFQSAPVVAHYVAAALEADYSWSRVERFFISSIEEDKLVKGIKVRISGRLGRKASMASIKEWEHGDHDIGQGYTPVDYGAASALTRMGVIGVKVWLRFHQHAIPDNAFTKKTGFAMPLTKILAQRQQRPPSSSSAPSPSSLPGATAWWNVPGPQQPKTHRTWQAFDPACGFEPTSATALEDFIQSKERFRFSSTEARDAYLKARGLQLVAGPTLVAAEGGRNRVEFSGGIFQETGEDGYEEEDESSDEGSSSSSSSSEGESSSDDSSDSDSE